MSTVFHGYKAKELKDIFALQKILRNENIKYVPDGPYERRFAEQRYIEIQVFVISKLFYFRVLEAGWGCKNTINAMIEHGDLPGLNTFYVDDRADSDIPQWKYQVVDAIEECILDMRYFLVPVITDSDYEDCIMQFELEKYEKEKNGKEEHESESVHDGHLWSENKEE